MTLELTRCEYTRSYPLIFTSLGWYQGGITVIGSPQFVLYFTRSEDAFAFCELMEIDKKRLK